jgi:hypothetical protein
MLDYGRWHLAMLWEISIACGAVAEVAILCERWLLLAVWGTATGEGGCNTGAVEELQNRGAGKIHGSRKTMEGLAIVRSAER